MLFDNVHIGFDSTYTFTRTKTTFGIVKLSYRYSSYDHTSQNKPAIDH